MKRRFTILTAALALLAFLAIPMGMWGQTTHTIGWGTASGDAGTYTNFSATSGNVGGILSFETAKNSSQTAPAYNSNSSELRIYYASNGDGGSITITPVSGLTITNAVITTSTSPSVAYYVDGGSAVSVSASNNTYTISGISASTSLKIQNANTSNTQLRIKTIALTYITDGPQPTTYTVTFDAGDGTFVGSTDFPNASNTMVAGTYTLPSAERSGYTFDGWTATGITTPVTGSYTVSGDVDFTAQYTQNSGSGVTATLTQSNLELTGSYTTNTSKTIDGITYVYTDLMKSSDNIQAKASTGTIKNTTAYPGDITEVKITHSGTARATTINGSADGTNWTQVETGSGSITADFSGRGYKYFQITRGTNAAYWTKIEITYSTGGSSQSQSDLAITNASTDLTFDLYNNATAQVINYTTSSTGAITITPAESSYFTYVHDAIAKTITVTPTAVTPSAQTVTINQEADEDYYAGTATFTVSVTNSDPTIPGSIYNPYTVAQARAAIDANTGTQGVYATGIVSEIVTDWSTQYNNITFNFVDEEGDEDFLQAYRCASGTGVDASQVAAGDVVVVYGNLTYYASTQTYEFASGCQLVSLTHPETTDPSVTVTPSTISAPYTGAEGTLALAYENIEEFISFDYYFCDANGDELEDTDPDYPGDWIYAEINEENDAYILSYLIDANDGAARTAYMKVYTFDDELEEVYAIVTVSQAAYEAPHVTWDLSIDQTATATEDEMTWTSDYATMGVAKANASTNTNNYYPGTEGHSYTSTRFYKNSELTLSPAAGYAITSVVFNATSTGYASALQESTWTNANATMEENGTIVTVTPTDGTSDMVAVIGGTCGFTSVTVYYVVNNTPSITVSPALVEVDANEHDGTLDLTYENLDITGMSDFDIQFFDENDNAIAGPDWMEVLVAEQDPTIGEGYVVSYMIYENEDEEAHIAYFKVWTYDEDMNEVYSNLVTINQAAPVAPVTGDKYVKVTSTADLTSGQYLIIYEEGSVAFNGGLETLDAASNTIEVVMNNSEIAVTTATIAAEFTIDMTAGTIMSASGYYIGQSSDANGMQTSDEIAYTNTISIDNEGNANIVSSDGAHLRYNATSGQERFRYYKSSSYTGQKAIQLYKKVGDEPATETYQLTINGYEAGSDGGYYLIASPVNVDPATVTGMTTGDFDLYYFDEGQELEWRNYEATPFNLVPGTGYLYAKKATTEGETFSFELTGTPYSGNGTVDLKYTENAESAGFNLIGNPFNTNATLDKPYYRLNQDGSALSTTTESSDINVMEGVFVQATAANQTANFTKVGDGTKKISQLNVMVTCNRSTVLDNAIIRFDNGAMLGKFQLNPNNTKLYFTESNQDFAVVRSANEGQMPINFKAAESGTYTISINAENVELNYLHLIDNMNNVDIDLLQNPSYSFDANTTDFESRFRLVYAANNAINEQGVENFVFFSNGNLIVNNEGNAMLQVVDITGRLISNNSISGSESISLHNMPAGIYAVRLINGNNVKVQKVVVK